MNLDEFLENMPLTAASFAEATKRMAKTDPTMDPSRDRPESWWYEDIAAYLEYMKLEEESKWSNAPSC